MSEAGASTWCKICGITSQRDARAVAAAGADAYGLNFYDASPRVVTVERAAEIARSVRDVKRVGLFVDASVAEIEAVLAAVPLDMLQFHGDEAQTFCASFGLPYIKAVRMRPELDFAGAEAAYEGAWALLLDTYVAGKAGGTGAVFDWSLWPAAARARLILAGGLTPANVAAGVRATRPFGVDVSGGVEKAKGVKDHALMERFIREARSVGS